MGDDGNPKMTLVRRGARAAQRANAMSRAERRATERRIRALQAKANTKARASNTKAKARRG